MARGGGRRKIRGAYIAPRQRVFSPPLNQMTRSSVAGLFSDSMYTYCEAAAAWARAAGSVATAAPLHAHAGALGRACRAAREFSRGGACPCPQTRSPSTCCSAARQSRAASRPGGERRGAERASGGGRAECAAAHSVARRRAKTAARNCAARTLSPAGWAATRAARAATAKARMAASVTRKNLARARIEDFSTHFTRRRSLVLRGLLLLSIPWPLPPFPLLHFREVCLLRQC